MSTSKLGIHFNIINHNHANTMEIDKIIISGLHFNLSEEVKQFIKNKSKKLINHQSLISSLSFELEKDLHSTSHSKEYIAKGHMSVKGKSMFFSASSESIYKSIDLLINKLDRGLRRRAKSRKIERKINKVNA